MLASGSIPLPPIPLKKTGESIILAPYWPGARGASGGDSRSLRRAPAKARSRSDRDDLGDQLVCGFSREVRATGLFTPVPRPIMRRLEESFVCVTCTALPSLLL